MVLDLTVTDLHQVCTENCNSHIRHHVVAPLPNSKKYHKCRFVARDLGNLVSQKLLFLRNPDLWFPFRRSRRSGGGWRVADSGIPSSSDGRLEPACACVVCFPEQS